MADGSYSPRILTAGVHHIDADAYHRDPAPVPSLSATLAKAMLAQSPLHAWTACPRLNPAWEPVEKKTFDIGRAAHRAILGAGGDYIEIPSGILATNGAASTKEAKAFISDARAMGKTPLKADEIGGILEMRATANDRLGRMKISLDPACSEKVAIAQIEGVWCRAMLDNVPLDPRQPIYDFKTCESAHPEACLKAVLNYGYDVQAAHYREVWRAATGEDRSFRFIFQEKSAPFEVCLVELGPDSLELASRKTKRAREIWAECLSADVWPGYPAGIHRVDLPSWAVEKWLERESYEAAHKRQHGEDVLRSAMRFFAPEGFQGATQ
jgi:hypothetical protein